MIELQQRQKQQQQEKLRQQQQRTSRRKMIKHGLYCSLCLALLILLRNYEDTALLLQLPTTLRMSCDDFSFTASSRAAAQKYENQAESLLLEHLQQQQQQPQHKATVTTRTAAQQPKKSTSSTNTTKYFVYHAGPPKTATTELQSIAKSKQDLLLQDNYIYDGMRQGGPLKVALQDLQKCREKTVAAHRAGEAYPECWQDFRTLLDNYTDHNVLFSCELVRFHDLVSMPEAFEIFQQELNDRGYELIFVVSYRRLFEWIPSAHTQMNRGLRPEWVSWLSDGGRRPTGLKNKVMSIDFVNPQDGEYYTTWTSTLLEALPASMHVKVLNMYAPGSMERKFFCDIVPKAHSMCDFIQQSEANGSSVGRPNPSTPTWYDMLAVDAAEQGLVDTQKYSRTEITEAVQNHQEVTLNRSSLDFPWLCPTEQEMQQIHDMSLHWERHIVPEFDDQEGFRESFQKTADEKKFCDLDTNATLAMKVWKDFFQDYAPKKR